MEIQQRWNVAKVNKLCFRCLGGNHFGQGCNRTRICGIDGCKESHNRLLHKERTTSAITTNTSDIDVDITPAEQNEPADEKLAEKNEGKHEATHITKQPKLDDIVLRTVPVLVKNGNRRMVVNALLDDGSTKTYVNEDIAAELKLKGEVQKVNVSVLNGHCEQLNTMPVEMQLESLDGKVKMKIEAFTTKRVTGNMKAVDWRPVANRWKHLQGIPLPNVGPRPIIDILIGLDYAELHCSLEEVCGQPGEPIARRTPLGWTCVGNTTGLQKHPLRSNFIRTYKASNPELQQLNATLEKFWEIESVADDTVAIVKKDEKAALEIAQRSLKFDNGKYELSLPWKDEQHLSNNYPMAMKRLMSTEKKLLRDPDLAETYKKILDDHVKKGYLVKQDVDPATDTGWYLPHFPVLRPDKSTTEVCIGFDGSARFEGKSLNDAIYPGPKLQQDLVNVLLRFRRFPVALVCDIAEMYLRIGVSAEDQRYQRMLWRELDRNKEPSVFQFTRLVFGINSSPFQAQYVSQSHAEKNQDKLPVAAETVLCSTYMDDSMDSKPTEKEAINLYRELSRLWSTANMHARKWLSNSSNVLREIPEQDRASEVDLNRGEFPSVKTLGVMWKAKDDMFTFKCNFDSALSNPTTKREFL